MASNSSVEKYGIVQYSGKDYDNWKFRMEIILDQQEVKECIEREHTNPVEEIFMKKDRKCKSLIIQCIANSHLQYVKHKSSAYQMWKALGAVFQRKGVATQLYVCKKLLSMKLQEGTSLEKHFFKFEETVREIKTVGTKLDQMDIICQLLLTLPKEYNAIVTTLETLQPEKLNLEFVKGKLLDQEIKRKNQQVSNSEDTTAFSSSSKAKYSHKRQFDQKNTRYNNNIASSNTYSNGTTTQFKCHNCGKPGHLRRDCRWRK